MKLGMNLMLWTDDPTAVEHLPLYERLGINVATTQFTDLAGRPQYLVGEHRPMPELT